MAARSAEGSLFLGECLGDTARKEIKKSKKSEQIPRKKVDKNIKVEYLNSLIIMLSLYEQDCDDICQNTLHNMAQDPNITLNTFIETVNNKCDKDGNICRDITNMPLKNDGVASESYDDNKAQDPSAMLGNITNMPLQNDGVASKT